MALKRAVCVARAQNCKNCLLGSRCIYAKTFEAIQINEPEKGGQATSPVPYLIEPPLDTRTRYRADTPFDFNLTLFGDTNDSLPYFIYAFEIMGETGIGAKLQGKRARFSLDEVIANGTVIYDSKTKKLTHPAPQRIRVEVPPENGERTLVLNLLTPLRLKHNNELSATLPFHILVRAMLRRVSLLFKQFGEGEPSLDYRGLILKAQNIRSVESRLRWHDWERYSSRQDAAMFMGGMIGSITYKGELAPYIPLLETCKILHIGKQSSFGLGLFEFQTPDET